MRSRFAAVLVLLVAGCLGEEAEPQPVVDDDCLDPPARADCPAPPVNATAGAPDLPLGRTWTYAVESFYEPAMTTVTVVVAEKGPGTYLFAGATPDDLGPEVVWGRGWHGAASVVLPREGWRWIDHPLQDGKTWEVREGFTVTARAEDVPVPGGTEPGFVIEGTRESDGVTRTFLATYAPSVGAATTMSYETTLGYYERLTLERVAESRTYTWFERGPRAHCDAYADVPPVNSATSAPLEVPEGHDAVLLSAGGAGGRGAVASPAGATWNGEGGSTETWTTATFPATPGTWGLACTAVPQGWYHVTAQAVTWVEADVGSGRFAPEAP